MAFSWESVKAMMKRNRKRAGIQAKDKAAKEEVKKKLLIAAMENKPITIEQKWHIEKAKTHFTNDITRKRNQMVAALRPALMLGETKLLQWKDTTNKIIPHHNKITLEQAMEIVEKEWPTRIK